ncbi:hypothetical protein [Roseomonas indoligenes]|uniref:Uncharacterized protein n=1 Tax=Roseomonas indoligenes TaxID=2820811 RepID=A0A940MTT3_9PROT|nr:hypothetical protein [Pararoseomonas indoligenes]MBP0493998.1 hypothetical protein [Pararoseomonas indoligenes]
MILGVLAFTIASLGFGVPIRDTETHQPIGTLKLLWITVLGLGSGLFWLGAGIFLYRSASRREDVS